MVCTLRPFITKIITVSNNSNEKDCRLQGVNANIITNLAELDINWVLLLLFVLHLNMNLDILITRFALPCTFLFSPCVDQKRPVFPYRPLFCV
jgi:hypothetical protein